jgi:hypothetical protein
MDKNEIIVSIIVSMTGNYMILRMSLFTRKKEIVVDENEIIVSMAGNYMIL